MPLADETSAALLTLIQQGDRRAEDELFRRHGKALLYVMRQRAGNRHEAEDISQETWRVLLEKFRTYGRRALTDPDRLPAYIQHTAVNLYLAQERKQQRHRTDTDSELLDEVVDDDHVDMVDELTRQGLRRTVRDCIGELRNERDRKLLYYYYIEERSKEAICSELQLESRHFDRVAHRARDRFRERFGGLERQTKPEGDDAETERKARIPEMAPDPGRDAKRRWEAAQEAPDPVEIDLLAATAGTTGKEGGDFQPIHEVTTHR